MTEGRGIFHAGDETFEVAAGDVATAGDGEVHWYENPHQEPFACYELWVPAPTETIWINEDDI